MTAAPQNQIIVGVDGSPSAEHAALWAAAEAQRLGATVRLVNAYSIPPVFYGPGARPEGINHAAVEVAATLLDRVREAVEQAYPGLAVSTLAREASAVDVLRNESAHAIMTVVGSHGSNRITESLLGSVAARISGHAHSPVVVVRTDPDGLPVGPPDTGKGAVVVGLDGSPDSDDALAFALQSAGARRSSLVAIRTWDDTTLDVIQRIYPTVIDRERADHREQQLLADQVRPWIEKYPEVAVQQIVLRGRPGTALLDYCRHAAPGAAPPLLVVGSRGRGGFTGMLLGSTSHTLIARSTCPVAIVRAHSGR